MLIPLGTDLAVLMGMKCEFQSGRPNHPRNGALLTATSTRGARARVGAAEKDGGWLMFTPDMADRRRWDAQAPGRCFARSKMYNKRKLVPCSLMMSRSALLS